MDSLPPSGHKHPAEPVWADCSLFKRLFHRRRATLSDCSECGADFVHPVEWAPNDGGTWWMVLRCGACGTSREETVLDQEAARYDRDLDMAEHRMRCAADRLSRELLEEEADSFATALRLDLIGVEDFRPRDAA
jgi:hypothetical protein